MKAIVQDTYGPAEVLRLAEIEPPVMRDTDVLVRVHAAGVDPSVWHEMTGKPYLMRAMGFGFRAPKTRTRGLDVAGTVEATGSKVTRLLPGDEVYGAARGSFAEFACAAEEKLVLKPPSLSFTEAAAVPVSAVTALQAVRDKGKVKAGQRLLVLGAGGGVGSFAVQLGKAFGAQVTGVCSTSKVELVKKAGADHVIDYTRHEPLGQGYDVIIDTGGNRSLKTLRQALAPKGTLVLVGGEGGGNWLAGTDRLLRAMMLSGFVSHKLTGLLAIVNAQDLDVLSGLIGQGQLMPMIDRTFPLEEAPAAVRYLENRNAKGKVVITVAGPN